jgi:3-hydroxyisobutyrate dehydrogenase
MDDVPAARGYSGGFAADLMLKDLGLAAQAARQARQSLALGPAAQQLYQSWSERGFGSQDFSSIIKLFTTA